MSQGGRATSGEEAGYYIRGFNALGLMVWENGKRSGVTQHFYDCLGNGIRLVDQLGNESSKRYDSAGRLIEEINGAGNVMQYSYDAFGRRTAQTLVDTIGGLGSRTTTLQYDHRDRLTQQTDAGGKVLRFGYDNRDNRTHSWDIAGDLTRQEYDGLNRVTLTEYEGVNGNLVTETRQFDTYGNLIAEQDAEGRVTSHEYGQFGRKIATVDQGNQKTVYEYDDFGNQIREYKPVTRSIGRAGFFSYGFDPFGEDFAWKFSQVLRELIYESLPVVI